MNKYTKQAIGQLAFSMVVSMVVAFSLAFLATVFGLQNIIVGLAIVVFLFCSYKYIKIQSEINERLDKLRKE